MKLKLTLTWRRVAAFVVAAPLAALAVGWLGILDVGARGGHWPVTNWFLHFVMRASVQSHAKAVTPPARLPDDALVPAAGHYARFCAPCHGAPDAPPAAPLQTMLPPPPRLVDKLADWNDAELFQIVLNGVRFTGMPAWPADRDDEVWMIVAFLRQLPRLDAAAYRRLAYGAFSGEGKTGSREENATGSTDAATEPRPGTLGDCLRCHGADGAEGGPHMPVLAGQSAAYVAASLSAYADGRRASGFMAGPAAAIAPADIDKLAARFAALPPPPPAPAGDAALVAAGRRLAERGRPADNIPACLGCHGAAAHPLHPRLAGQPAAYLAAQLQLFRDSGRGGGPAVALMRRAAARLGDADIAALAAYFAAEPPARPRNRRRRRRFSPAAGAAEGGDRTWRQ
jgi:cytochrome c553